MHKFLSTAAAVAVVLLLSPNLLARQETADDPAAFIRKAYHSLVNEEVTDYDECIKLVEICKSEIARLAQSDPEALIALAREIVLDHPELLESEKQRGIAPPRLAIKSALMGAAVIVGGEGAYALLTELAQKVESGEVRKQALGANPADLLEVPVKFNRMLVDALEGKSDNPKQDLDNAIRFAQEHFVAKILLAESVPGLSDEDLLKVREAAVSRLRKFLLREEPENALAVMVYWKVIGTIYNALMLDDGATLPEDWHKRLTKLSGNREKETPVTEPEAGKKPQGREPEKRPESEAGKLNLRKMDLPEEKPAGGKREPSEEPPDASRPAGASGTLPLALIAAAVIALIITLLLLRNRKQHQ